MPALLSSFMVRQMVAPASAARLSRRALTRYAARHKDLNQAALYTVSRLLSYLFLVGGLAIVWFVREPRKSAEARGFEPIDKAT